MMRVFKDRRDAGTQLAHALHHYFDAADAVVLAHTRPSIEVAYEVATRLGLPLDMLEHDEACFAQGSQIGLAESAADIPLPRELDVRDRTVLLVDDGDAAREMAFAIERLRAFGAASIVAAVGVASPAVFATLQELADHTTCVLTPQHLFSIEAWYADLTEPSDDDIRQLLVTAAQNVMVLQRSNFLSPRV
jgi:predicted phosphoribosyltransferase